MPNPTLVLGLLFFGVAVHAAEELPVGLERRIPWTTSRLVGSPEPPLPYTVEKVFMKIPWKLPMYLAAEPGTDSLLVVQQGGEKERPSTVLRVADDPEASTAEPFFELGGRLIYSLTFHPGYPTNGWLYVFSNGPTGQGERTNQITRYTVARTPPYRCDTNSAQLIIEWRSAGHDGGGLAFGRDGMLYISTGDGTSDSDGWDTGQGVDELLGGVLRIDVDRPEGSRLYSVPRDNPFVGRPGARAEIWAYGLRNPWRLAADERTGQVWVGNNGQDLWETAHLIRRGENYGWSVYEGSHPFYLQRRRGPTPIVPPTIEHPHSEARSLTGGLVYRGASLPDLDGVYVYGDYSTGRIWGGRHDGNRLTWHHELTATMLQIAGFGVGHHGSLYVVDHGGGIFRLVPAPKQSKVAAFPRRLSETGLFRSVKDHRVQSGLVAYSVNAPGWTDGASAQRFLALPGDARIDHTATRGWNFPEGSVVMETLSLETQAGDPTSRRRIETRVLLRQQGQWAGYSYRWNERQTDADLVEARGAERSVRIRQVQTAGGRRTQTWRFPGRAECLGCHSRAANFVLGLCDVQMNRDQDYGGIHDNQLRALDHIGLFKESLPKATDRPAALVDPHDRTQDLEARARSYLHANCSPCHVEAGGGNAKMELEFATARDRMNLLGARPQHDTFGLDNAMLVAPGDPDRSILLQRISRRGRGQMPPLVSTTVDTGAAQLMREWIRSMKPTQSFVHEWTVDELDSSLTNVKAGRSFEAGRAAFRDVGCIQCHRFGGEGGSVGPDLSGVAGRLRPHEVVESIVLPSKVIAPEYTSAEIQIRTGGTLTGRIEREDARELVLRPAGAEEAVTVRKADIARRGLSTVSNMPSGILNTLERVQVLDLLAYLLSDGNAGDAAFR